MLYNYTEEQQDSYRKILIDNPMYWAGPSIDRIDEIIKAGTHEPSQDGEVDPDVLVRKNKQFLEGQVVLFNYLGLPVPSEIPPTILKATEFLKDETL